MSYSILFEGIVIRCDTLQEVMAIHTVFAARQDASRTKAGQDASRTKAGHDPMAYSPEEKALWEKDFGQPFPATMEAFVSISTRGRPRIVSKVDEPVRKRGLVRKLDRRLRSTPKSAS